MKLRLNCIGINCVNFFGQHTTPAAFVELQKTFDMLGTWAFLKSIGNARMGSRYSNLIQFIYEPASKQIKMDIKSRDMHGSKLSTASPRTNQTFKKAL